MDSLLIVAIFVILNWLIFNPELVHKIATFDRFRLCFVESSLGLMVGPIPSDGIVFVTKFVFFAVTRLPISLGKL